MIFDPTMRELSSPNISEAILESPLKELRKIINENSEPVESQYFKNRKKELIIRLEQTKNSGENFKQATDVPGRERLLLSIYLEYLNQSGSEDWLPVFDGYVAQSILGTSGSEWHKGRRRQVTLLFFSHFDRIGPLPFLCDRLREAYQQEDENELDDVKKWHRFRTTIFDKNGPEKIITKAGGNVSLQVLMEKFAIPTMGRFAEALRSNVFLKKFKAVPFGKHDPIFEEIEEYREEWVSSELRLGAAALKIMVGRVKEEGHENWPGDWAKWITRFGCDPRLGQASAEGSKWWGWASISDLNLAKKGITGLTLKFFIDFLKESLAGSGQEEQFKPRRKFLRELFEKGRIRNARLALNKNAYVKLDPKYRNPWSVSKLVVTTDQTSMICLDCVDDVQIIEGTHNFGLRAFRPDFPIEGFWESPQREYQDSQLRITPKKCLIWQPHAGNWVQSFIKNLQEKFHLEWNDLEI